MGEVNVFSPPPDEANENWEDKEETPEIAEVVDAMIVRLFSRDYIDVSNGVDGSPSV